MDNQERRNYHQLTKVERRGLAKEFNDQHGQRTRISIWAILQLTQTICGILYFHFFEEVLAFSILFVIFTLALAGYVGYWLVYTIKLRKVYPQWLSERGIFKD